MTKDELESRTHTKYVGQTVYYSHEVDSTNTWAKRLAEEGAPNGTLTTAETQTAGKGRRGRVWKSPEGTSVSMSLLLYPDLEPAKAPMLTIVMGLAVVQGVQRALGVDTRIKWPNDAVLNGKKLCGILTEMSAQIDYINYVVIGTGINVNQTEFPEEIAEIATSLAIEMGHSGQSGENSRSGAGGVRGELRKIPGGREISPALQEAYEAVLANKDQPVRVLDPKEPFEGVALGITSTGELRVQKRGWNDRGSAFRRGFSARPVQLCIEKLGSGKENIMYSDDEKVVLCGASAYEQKYYFNQDFASLPQSVQDELHIMCVMFTVEIGGIFTMWFDSDGSLQFETEAVDADAMYDEIGGALRIKQYQEEKKDLLESLELYYRVFFLGEEVPEEAFAWKKTERSRMESKKRTLQTMPPLKIGNVEMQNPLVLAPMAGVTDLPFRVLCKEQGAGLICMEMVSAKAILYKNKNTEDLMTIRSG